MEEKKVVIFIDSGDTIIDEGTEVRDGSPVVQRGGCLPGAQEMLKTLRERGYKIALVADGLTESFYNLFSQNNLFPYFDALVYSEEVGVEKPHPLIYAAAMKALGLELEDIPRIIMVGNNLTRDIRGANYLGITSVFISWTPRYPKVPMREEDVPKYTIREPMELVDLVEKLNEQLSS